MASEEVIKSWTKADGTCDMVQFCALLTLTLYLRLPPLSLSLSSLPLFSSLTPSLSHLCYILIQLAGIVYVGPSVAKSMVYIHTVPPLDACTYFGLDNGAQPLSVSLLPPLSWFHNQHLFTA